MNDDDRQALEHVVTGSLVVQLEPYRERRRTRSRAAALLTGWLLGAYLLPAAADLLTDWLTVDEPSNNGNADRVAAYTDGGGEDG